AGGRKVSRLGRGPFYGGVLGFRGGRVDERVVSGRGPGQDLDGFYERPRGLRLFLALGEGLARRGGHLRYGGAARQPEPAGVDRAHLAARADGGDRSLPALRPHLHLRGAWVPGVDGRGAAVAAVVGGRRGGVAAPVVAAALDAGARAGIPDPGPRVGGRLGLGPQGLPVAHGGLSRPGRRAEALAGAGTPVAARAAAVGGLLGGVHLRPGGDARRPRRGRSLCDAPLRQDTERGFGECLLGQCLHPRGGGPFLYGAPLRAERGDPAVDGLRGVRAGGRGHHPHRGENSRRGRGRFVGAGRGLSAGLPHRLAQLSRLARPGGVASAGAGSHRVGAVPARPAGCPGAVGPALERRGHRRRDVRAYALSLRLAGALGSPPGRRKAGRAGDRSWQGGVRKPQSSGRWGI
ncbi:MAG: hypothetical protein AVDCRST_MAG55-1893, partial [uncultured Rubrobacteraceae bacterium]